MRAGSGCRGRWRAMGLRALYRRPGASRGAPEHPVYPYLMRNVRITRPNQSLPPNTIESVGRGHHLPAHGPWVPQPSGSGGLAQPVRAGLASVQHPPIGVGGGLWRPASARGAGSRTARGVQHGPRQPVHQLGVHPGPPGAWGEDQHGWEGRYQDNIFVERLRRTVKCEGVVPEDLRQRLGARKGLEDYFRSYNGIRPIRPLATGLRLKCSMGDGKA